MLYYLGGILTEYFGPARLLQSYTVLIALALYSGFLIVRYFLPSFYNVLPHDRGREFTVNAEAAKGKPTGAGVVWVSAFVILSMIFVPLDWIKCSILILTWLMMLTGYLDDHSINSWGEYRKALLDLFIAVLASVLLAFYLINSSEDSKIYFWIPFFTHELCVSPWLFVVISTVMIWASINTTNCTDGVDGLSSTLVLVALLTLGMVFYFILGHKDIAVGIPQAQELFGKLRGQLIQGVVCFGRSLNGLSLAQRFSEQCPYGRRRKPCPWFLYRRLRNGEPEPIHNSRNFFAYFH